MQNNKKKAQKEKLIAFMLSLSAVVVVLPVLAILYFLITKGSYGLRWSFLTQVPRHGMQEGGTMPALVGTLYLVAGTLAFAVPVGILAAVYLTECAGRNAFTRLVRLAIFNLAGVPSAFFSAMERNR